MFLRYAINAYMCQRNHYWERVPIFWLVEINDDLAEAWHTDPSWSQDLNPTTLALRLLWLSTYHYPVDIAEKANTGLWIKEHKQKLERTQSLERIVDVWLSTRSWSLTNCSMTDWSKTNLNPILSDDYIYRVYVWLRMSYVVIHGPRYHKLWALSFLG